MFRSFATLLFGSVLLGGCIMLPIPNYRQISPQFHGQVKDAESGLPVSNATVRVVAELAGDQKINAPLSAATQTDETGLYRVVVVTHESWYVLFVGPAEGTCSGTLKVTHPDYIESNAKASEFRGAAFNGMCNGFVVQRDLLLKRR